MLGLGSNRLIAKDVNSCTYCCYFRCATLIVRLGGIPWSQSGAPHQHAELGLQDKGPAIKELVVCYVVLLGSTIYDGFVDKRKVPGSGPLQWSGWQQPLDTYHIHTCTNKEIGYRLTIRSQLAASRKRNPKLGGNRPEFLCVNPELQFRRTSS